MRRCSKARDITPCGQGRARAFFLHPPWVSRAPDKAGHVLIVWFLPLPQVSCAAPASKMMKACAALCVVALTISQASATTLCTDTCQFAGNGVCEDGGTNSIASAPSNRACAYGTDCGDCGTRSTFVAPCSCLPDQCMCCCARLLVCAVRCIRRRSHPCRLSGMPLLPPTNAPHLAPRAHARRHSRTDALDVGNLGLQDLKRERFAAAACVPLLWLTFDNPRAFDHDRNLKTWHCSDPVP